VRQADGRLIHGLESQGIGALATSTALAGLDRALADGHAQLGVFAVDWSRVAAGMPRVRRAPWLAALVDDHRGTSGAAGETVSLRHRLAAAPEAERRDQIAAELANALRAELGERIGALDLLSGPSIADLAERLAVDLTSR
jgi:hypothetical protein